MKIIFKSFFILAIGSFCFGQIMDIYEKADKSCGQHYIDPTKNSDFKSQNIKYKWGIAFKNGKAVYFDHPKMNGMDFHLCPSDTKKIKQSILKNSIIEMGSPDHLIVHDSKKTDPLEGLEEGRKFYCMKIENYKMYLRDENSDWEPVTITFKGEITRGENYLGEDTESECLLFNIKTKWFKGNYVYVCEPDDPEHELDNNKDREIKLP